MHKTHPDFEFIKYADRDQATLFIGGAGSGPSGKVKTEGYDHYAPGHYYVKCSDEVRDRLYLLCNLNSSRSHVFVVACLV
jgi:hypothetical protein